MSIIPANQLSCKNRREEIVNAFCDNLMTRIQKHAAEGKHHCCFDASVYYEKATGKIYSEYQDKWRGSPDAYSAYEYYFDNYASEVKEKFRQAGYIIKPTGYIGGVWQLTEDICW